MVELEVVKEFIDAFFNGLKSTTITLFGKYSFSLFDLCISAAIVSILAYFLYKYFNG